MVLQVCLLCHDLYRACLDEHSINYLHLLMRGSRLNEVALHGLLAVAPIAPLALLHWLCASPRKLEFVYPAPIYLISSFKYKKYTGYSKIIGSLLINNTADRMKLGCKLKELMKAKIW